MCYIMLPTATMTHDGNISADDQHSYVCNAHTHPRSLPDWVWSASTTSSQYDVDDELQTWLT